MLNTTYLSTSKPSVGQAGSMAFDLLSILPINK